MSAATPANAADKDRAKVVGAIRTFRLAKATREQRQQAVRDLIDILEFHRPAVRAHLGKKGEGDLFNIANNFALRHHNSSQSDDYGEDWLTWLFYLYLSTVHLVLGRVHDSEAVVQNVPPPSRRKTTPRSCPAGVDWGPRLLHVVRPARYTAASDFIDVIRCCAMSRSVS